MKRKKNKRKLISQNTPTVIQFNLPTNIGLGGVSNIGGEIEEEKIEEKDEDEEEEEEDDEQNDENQNEILREDDNIDMPIDFIRDRKKNFK